LADAYPNRHVLGLGGGGERPGSKPMAAMTAYLDELDALESPNPPRRRRSTASSPPTGPRCSSWARDRSAGAHTYHVNVAHTAQARDILGADAFLGVEHAVLFESDPPRPGRSPVSTCRCT